MGNGWLIDCQQFCALSISHDDIDQLLMSSMSNWFVRLLINYLMIIHRLVIDYTSHTVSSNFFFPVIKIYVYVSLR